LITVQVFIFIIRGPIGKARTKSFALIKDHVLLPQASFCLKQMHYSKNIDTRGFAKYCKSDSRYGSIGRYRWNSKLFEKSIFSFIDTFKLPNFL
jgi:hypothetical protein